MRTIDDEEVLFAEQPNFKMVIDILSQMSDTNRDATLQFRFFDFSCFSYFVVY